MEKDTVMDIPRDKNHPSSAVQCGDCGGHGCNTCSNRGWLSAGHPKRRVCLRDDCGMPLRPDHVAVYCSNRCAMMDAS
jgi:hypothetical protein